MAVATFLAPRGMGGFPEFCYIQNHWTQMTPEGKFGSKEQKLRGRFPEQWGGSRSPPGGLGRGRGNLPTARQQRRERWQ